MEHLERMLTKAEIGDLIDWPASPGLAAVGCTAAGRITAFGAFVRRVEFDRLLDDAFGPLSATQTAQNDLAGVLA